jgi:hypothetical protein
MSANEVQIPEEIQMAIIGDFLQAAAGQGVQTLVQLTIPGVNDAIRLNAALALTGMYDLMVDTAEYADDLGPANAEVRWQENPGDGYGDGEAVEEEVTELQPDIETYVEPPEGTVTTEEALARLQALSQQQLDDEEARGADSLGGASGIGPRNPRASRKRRKHGRR